MTEKEFANDVEAICKRPAMYTPHGTFFELYSFLDGFGIASPDHSTHSVFTPFLNWLAQPDRQERTFPISLDEFQSRFLTDDEAALEFASLYRQYVESND